MAVPDRQKSRYSLEVRFLPLMLATIALSCSSSTRGAGERTELTTKEIVDRAKQSVVRIEAGRGVGTGFVVGADGRIATNLHVIEDAGEIIVHLSDKRQFRVDRVVAIDPARDLVILHIDASNLVALPIGNSDQVSAGERVVIIGNPLGVLDYTVSDGLISSVRPLSDSVTVLQTSAPISQGSSGGPLFNDYGEVIGIATFFSTEGQNLNFAIPSNYLRPLLSQRGGLTVAEFLEKLRSVRTRVSGECKPRRTEIRAKTPDGTPVLVERDVPCHDVSKFEDCTPEQMNAVNQAIGQAIAKGAPIYNAEEHEACFVIYRKVATDFEADNAMCKAVRDAFGAGLLRASAVDTFTEKAWVIRDTFDGLVDVLSRTPAADEQ
jgi:hypothetical protein